MSEDGSKKEFLITFVDESVAKANRLAEDLGTAIAQSHKEVSVTRKREDEDAQDFGSSLAVLLAAPAAVAVAKGIEHWLAKHHSVGISITTEDGVVCATNLKAKDAVRLAEVFLGCVQGQIE